MRSLSSLLLGALALGGCERGCLARWWMDHGAGGGKPEQPGAQAPATAFALSGIDCSDGLLRCVAGRVEASRTAHLPASCAEHREGACACPWEPVARCSSRCAIDGLEVVGAPSDAGAEQLCAPAAPVARPVFAADPVVADVCARVGVACVDGIVQRCEAVGRPARALAVCLDGCQPHVALDEDPTSRGIAHLGGGPDPGARTNPDGLASILCRHDHAERR